MSLSYFTNVKIKAIVGVVPENFIDIDDEKEYYYSQKHFERNKKILGLKKRHIAPLGVSTLDLCERAARILIQEKNIDISSIDTLIVASINHDYNGSCSACIIQGHLNLSNECACFDMSGLGCTDLTYALWVAHSIIQSGASKKCLLLEGSLSSAISNVENRNSSMLFGDGAAAILLEYSPKETKSFFHLQSYGCGWKHIVTPAGGFRFPIRKDIIDMEIKDNNDNPIHLWDSIMNGIEVFKFAISSAPASIAKILEYANMDFSHIDFFAIHQANAQIVKTIIKHAGIPPEKASSQTFSKYGNCGGTSVLINFCDEMKGKEFERILFSSFGVGLSVGSCILEIKSSENLGLFYYETPSDVQSREQMIKEWVDFIKGENND
ncbi:hypothetical protein CCY99_08030 [Helicobacter sp. 16-1353]|uniref:ketoacyl-ACP synthase III n=1 Tax=Helicobacter sp. 16-1353 TaxID=2004996 RepID=UPI000DCC11C6|nr:ketoacyl-ACP synthase III [Helicobacter sp. 16-1353]RAX51899.1 hypothetical protein CCY99_08030 [Helicobacter sp. 16-1353]